MNCCWSGSASNPASGWHNNREEMEQNPLYQLMDINLGGSLVRLFEEHGPEAVQSFCKAEIQPNYLYNGGEGRMIDENDYKNWRKELDSSELLESTQDLASNRFVQFKSHCACWDLNKRGVMGETVLHLCYHNSSPVHNEIAKILLQLYPKMASDIVEKEQRYGESALHLAVINGDLDSVKLLVQSGADVNQQATGKFFLPEDQMKKETNNTDYIGYAYYGEYPLAFAACFGRESIYDFLLRNGADPNLQDSLGNTVLHMVVINNQLDMYSYAVRHHIKPANTWIKNGRPGSKDGLTPLALASKLGRQYIFNEIMELHRIELWRFSNIGCSLYPLHAVDSIGIGGKTNWNSALMMVVNGETDNHLEMLQGGVIRQLLDEKWKTFVRRQFFIRLMLLLLHLTLMTCAVCLRLPHDVAVYEKPADGVRFACEVVVVLGCIGNLLLHIEEWKALGFLIFIINLKNAPSKAVFLLSCIMIILCVPVRLVHIGVEFSNSSRPEIEQAHDADLLQRMEETMLIIAIPCGWCMLLFFAKGHSLTGTSVMMFYKILIGDIVRFGIIYGIFLICFSQAFYSLNKGDKKDPLRTLMSLIHMTFGEFNYSSFEKTVLPTLTKIVFILFMFVMPILLLNMLIAMMGNTYMSITAKSEKEWIRQWAKLVMVLERVYSRDALLKFQDKYSVTVDSPPERDAAHLRELNLQEELGDEKVNYRALMVIKSSSKTMAKQRKDAISNWKWMFKETLHLIREVRKSGYSGEIAFKHLFPDGNQFSLYDNTLLRNKTSNMSSKRRSSCALPGDGDPDWTAAVHQLAWEKDLNLSTEGGSLRHNLSHPPPLDEVNTPPESVEHKVAGPHTESTTMEMDYINDEELEAMIQQAEGFKTASDSGKGITS